MDMTIVTSTPLSSPVMTQTMKNIISNIFAPSAAIPTMPKKAWLSLTPGERSQWDTFSEEAKAIILGSRAGFLHPHHRTRALAPLKSPNPSPPSVRFVEGHDIADSTTPIADFEREFMSAVLCHFHNLDPNSSEFVNAMCDDQAALRESFQTS